MLNFERILKETVMAYFKVLPRHLCGGIEKNNENPLIAVK
jgi:hypothetical protein